MVIAQKLLHSLRPFRFKLRELGRTAHGWRLVGNLVYARLQRLPQQGQYRIASAAGTQYQSRIAPVRYCSRLSIVSAWAEMRHLTRSPIERTPTILAPFITGRCRTRSSAMTRMQSTTVSLGSAVTRSRVIISSTRVSCEDFPLRMTFRV